jgi:hypothetical protein
MIPALGALAAVLVVGLLTTALILSRLQTHPTTPGSKTPTVPTATVPGTTWVVPQGLAELDGEPVIAPSNPQLLYRATVSDTQAVPVQLFRSLDGGTTWQSLSSPTVSGQVGGASFAVSPLSAQTVVLELQLFAGNSQENLLASVTPFGAGPTISYAHFVSVDGGLHWSALSLPQSGSSPGDAHLFPLGGLGSASAFLRAQGLRLYAALGVDANGVLDAHGVRLITSTDGGLTWSQADQALVVNKVVVCDALPVPGSSEVFAIVRAAPCQGGGALQLWKSTDAGATWNRVNTLSGTGEQGMALTSQGSNAPLILYVRLASDNPAVSNLIASTDEGKTWVKAPAQGIPAGLQLLTGPLLTLSDGSVLVAFEAQDTTSQAPFTLYRWKAGDAAWQQVGPSFNGSPDYVLVVDGTLWMVTIHGQGAFTLQRLG